MLADELLHEAHCFLTCDFSGSMTAHAIAYDVQSNVRVDEAGILVVVALAADIRLSKGYKAHALLTSDEVQGARSCTMISIALSTYT
jgi:hypothetical protein